MNKRYNIKIPIKFEIEGVEELTKALKINVNTMLNPFYISETSLLSLFMDEEEYEKFHPKARELIFNASLRASEFSYGKLRGFSEEHKLLLKRELTLCLVINSFAKHFNKGFELSHQRSKSFAEFSVATTVKNSPALLEDMIKNSNSCVTEAKKAINDLSQVAASLGAMNLKGGWNISNAFTFRLWLHNNLPEKSSAIFASNKIYSQNGNLYKDGLTYVSDSRINYNG